MKKILSILLLFCSCTLVFAQAELKKAEDEIECSLPDNWRCGSRMADILDGIDYHAMTIVTHKECINSSPANACNTSNQDLL
ncbi:hypothetical protein AWW68_06100 [Roseivirga spongicola]|uniref:Uncharacterized protein n=1 Tax=Roseivirga spongicola TaxID=333140 RepID=A0A150XHY8_9BACT|nr:hypothetical protein AWW68_06100 [Roseivirga spongicola]MBO6762806.1 hypothetical protein [Roseivirga sp.]